MPIAKSILVLLAFCLMTSCANKSLQNRSADITDPKAITVSILCYNIHHANPPSKPGIIDLQAIANVIKAENPDLVALQEVDVFTDRSGKSVHQANELARLTGMKAYFAKAIDYGGGEYGVAILSKLPMEEMKNTPLPTAAENNGERRTLASAVITLNSGKKILFAVTHLDAQSNATNRLLQINKIAEILNPEPLPVVIAGDFNAVPGSEVINILDQHFTRSCVTNCGYTIPVETPNKTIDFIAFKPKPGFVVLQHKVINEKYASDHLPVHAILKLKN